jgi:hypothetical protein
MARDGWIMVHRKSMENEIYVERPFDCFHAWLDLLFRANTAPVTIAFAGDKLKLDRGEFLTSYSSLAEVWGWNRQTVRKFILGLQEKEMIGSQIVRSKKQVGVKLSICNFCKYQTTENAKGSPKKTDDSHSKEYNYINIIANAGDKTIELWSKSEWQTQVACVNNVLKKIQKLNTGDPALCAMLIKRHGFLLAYAKVEQIADNEPVFKDAKGAKAYIIASLKKASVGDLRRNTAANTHEKSDYGWVSLSDKLPSLD